MWVTTVFFCSGQSSTDSAYMGTLNSVKADVIYQEIYLC